MTRKPKPKMHWQQYRGSKFPACVVFKNGTRSQRRFRRMDKRRVTCLACKRQIAWLRGTHRRFM